MQHNWYHFTVEVPPDVVSEGADAVEAFVAEAYERQAQHEHGTSYADLHELVVDAQKDALERIANADAQAKASAEAAKRTYTPLAEPAAEKRRTDALNAAAESVWAEYPRSLPDAGGEA